MKINFQSLWGRIFPLGPIISSVDAFERASMLWVLLYILDDNTVLVILLIFFQDNSCMDFSCRTDTIIFKEFWLDQEMKYSSVFVLYMWVFVSTSTISGGLFDFVNKFKISQYNNNCTYKPSHARLMLPHCRPHYLAEFARAAKFGHIKRGRQIWAHLRRPPNLGTLKEAAKFGHI